MAAPNVIDFKLKRDDFRFASYALAGASDDELERLSAYSAKLAVQSFTEIVLAASTAKVRNTTIITIDLAGETVGYIGSSDRNMKLGDKFLFDLVLSGLDTSEMQNAIMAVGSTEAKGGKFHHASMAAVLKVFTDGFQVSIGSYTSDECQYGGVVSANLHIGAAVADASGSVHTTSHVLLTSALSEKCARMCNATHGLAGHSKKTDAILFLLLGVKGMQKNSLPMLVAPRARPAPDAGNEISAESIRTKMRQYTEVSARLDALKEHSLSGGKKPYKRRRVVVPVDSDSEDEKNGAIASLGQPPADSEMVADTDPDESNGAKAPSGQPPVLVIGGSQYTISTHSE
jgi:hypothetical protein